MKIMGFMVPNLDQFLSFLAITGSPCPIRKVKPKYSVYPLFNQYRKKLSFEVQFNEQWIEVYRALAFFSRRSNQKKHADFFQIE
jgi:hypothetical protein